MSGVLCPTHTKYHTRERDGYCWFGNHYPEPEVEVDTMMGQSPAIDFAKLPALEAVSAAIANVQAPLDGLLWNSLDLDADTELPIRIAVSGSVDYTREVLERIGLTGMEPGDLIVLTVGVKVRDMGLGEDAKEHRRGRLVLALQSVNAAEIRTVRDE